MIIQAYRKRENGTLDLLNPVIVDSENIPEGLFLVDQTKHYNSDGYEIEPPEPQPQEPSVEERLQALESMELERILGGGF